MLPTLFNYEGQQLRTVIKDGEPWFVAKDACDILELGNPSMTLSRLDEDEKGISSIDTLGGSQSLAIVNEPGLYSLILGSRKPEAKQFKRWITHEVIPSIRKTGSYQVQQLSPQLQLLINMELKQKELEEQIAEARQETAKQQTTLTNHEFALSDLRQQVVSEITLTTREQKQIQGAVNSRARILGNPDSYRHIYGALKRQFCIPSYRDLRRSELTKAFEFIRCWTPQRG